MIRDVCKALFGLISVLILLAIISYQTAFKADFIEHLSVCCLSVFSNLRLPVFKIVIPAGLLYFVFWVVLHEKLSHRKIQSRKLNKQDALRDFAFSLIYIFNSSTLAIITSVVAHRYSLIYQDIHQHGYVYAFLSFCVLVLAADCYYYWLHRLLHHKNIFRFFHRMHHLTHTPHPLTAFSVSPIEQILNWFFYPVFICAVPAHVTVLFIFIIFHSTKQLLGHLGYEIFSNGAANGWLRWNTTTTHHDMHHERIHCNYGLYFTFWDTLLGTNHPDYKTTLLKFSEKRSEK